MKQFAPYITVHWKRLLGQTASLARRGGERDCRRRIWIAAVVLEEQFVFSGLAYTAWSEWYNTRIAHAWAYAPTMPTLFGIGLSPLAQWLAVPAWLVFVLRRRAQSQIARNR